MNEQNEALLAELKTLKEQVSALTHKEADLRHQLAGINIERISTLKPAHALSEPATSIAGFLHQLYDDDSVNGVELLESIESYAAKDTFPIPSLSDREHYYPNQDLDYWLSGLRDYLRVRQELKRLGKDLSAGSKVFELGAASARVTRHFAAQAPELNATCCDVNYNHVEWVSTHLPTVTAFQNTSFPILPIEDRSFDLVTAFSVFTHVDELEGAWLMELNRILKPGGYAYITVQTERVWDMLKDGEKPYDITFRGLDGREEVRQAGGIFLYHHLKSNNHILPVWNITPELFANPMPQHKVVFRFNNGVVYNTCTFHRLDFLQSQWGKIFEWVDFFPGASSFQDAVLLRKRS